MNSRNTLPLIAVGLFCAAATYVATNAWQSNATPTTAASTERSAALEQWLQLTPQQTSELRGLDSTFAAEMSVLEARLTAERERLAAMFDNPTTPNDVLLKQVEAVIAAHDAVERRVAAHVIALRPHLTAAQQKQMFEKLASGVREGGYRWRHGQPEGEQRSRGGGPPADRGRGRGRGRGPDGLVPTSSQPTSTPRASTQPGGPP